MASWKKKEEKLSHIGGKVCVFGGQGTGKSTFTGTFPRINLVDAEDGQSYYLEENPNIINVLSTVSAADVQSALDELNDPELLDEFDTITIDSGTKLYENMQAAGYEVAENRAIKQKQKGKAIDLDDLNLSQRDWGHIKRWNQRLATAYILFSNLGKWTVVTAHVKDIDKEIRQENGETKRVKIGERPDLPKKAEHDFDIVLRTFTKKNDRTGEITFHAEVLKDRTGCTQVGNIIDNPTFEIWRKKWEKSRKYGAKNLDLSKSVDTDRNGFEVEQEEEDNVADSFRSLIQASSPTDKAEILKKIKQSGIENPLKPKSGAEIQALKAIIKTHS